MLQNFRVETMHQRFVNQCTIDLTLKGAIRANAERIVTTVGRDRYSSYHPQSPQLTDRQQQQLMQEAIQAAHRQLVQSQQLRELATVLKYPTNREPPEGMY